MPNLITKSNNAIIAPRNTVVSTTAMVCLVKDFLSGQIIFLNSAFKLLNKLFFFFALSSMSFSLSCRRSLLFGFLMQCVCLAESAILLCLHSLRMCFLILRHVVIPLLTFRTCQCNPYTHNFHLRYYFCNSGQKKRALRFHTPIYYTIKMTARQAWAGKNCEFHHDIPYRQAKLMPSVQDNSCKSFNFSKSEETWLSQWKNKWELRPRPHR